MLPFLFALLHGAGAAPPTTYNGRARELNVAPPRIEASVTIDGSLDEPVWKQAALLTGFSQYAPVDGRPAEDSTEILVWYSPTAIHFGVRAFAKPGTVHATLADRDKIFSDDYIGIFLDCFNDKRQATVFAVNPLGVQGDGTAVEAIQNGGGFGGLGASRPPTDVSPDFIFQSKGRLTDWGYEVEIRIPFKSLKYQSVEPQAWGMNIIRRVQSSGHEDSWAPTLRAAASYLGQIGSLNGLTDLRRGLVLDVNPFVTGHSNGSSNKGVYGYDTQKPSLGTNVRWGITNNVTLNGTIKPDFAEVESDAGQIQSDPRNALFFPEKRPFFLDGIEQFATPNNLVYTRRIAEPVAAAKFTGKIAGTSVALLSGVDDPELSVTRRYNPVYNILRVTRDLGGASKAGFVYTDKIDGGQSNRVAGIDGRFVFSKIYSAQLQVAASRTVAPGFSDRISPLWQAIFARSGRTFGLRYSMNSIDENFRASSGFISRAGVSNLVFDHSLTWYGKENALIQTISQDVVLNPTWQYRSLVDGRAWQDKKLHLNTNASLRGGWQVGASVLIESFGYDHGLYDSFAIGRQTSSGLQFVPFTGVAHIANLDYLVQVASPQFKRFDFNIFYLWGRDENFYEWASADIGWLTLGGHWRPTDKLRVNGTYNTTFYMRHTDGSLVGDNKIPRVKVEYQLARPLFVRLVGEYDATFQDDLRDDSRTNDPLYHRNRDGTYTRLAGFRDNQFRADGLVAFQPNPGTVFFVGYGSTLTEPDQLRFKGLQRQRDAFFVKASYLFRM
ncbi:MAG: DUF5916 domain-containing protein [Gemmatimonadota bacterium]|nr:DUF5916 domain-containing protein [Gemmatimonadota bacterium]